MDKYLVFDIGNSETDWAVFQGNLIIQKGQTANAQIKKSGSVNRLVGVIQKQNVIKVFIGSVNPGVANIISKQLKKNDSIPIIQIKPEKQKLIKVKYSPISSIGIDRLANAVAAQSQCSLPLVVVDFGSATTFNVVKSKREYVGGAIAIGVQMANKALHQNTALLPEIELKNKQTKKVNVIGKTTEESLRSGLIQGFGAMVDGMIERIKREVKTKKLTVIATGGMAHLIKPYSKSIQKIDSDLTLKGIYLIGKSIYG